MAKTKLTIAIISYNEEDIIGKMLEACADIADEIVLVDSFSSDNTIEIAKAFNVKLFQEEWKGFVQQKNSAMEKCSNDWILNLDSDEVLTPEIKKEILQKINSETIKSYKLDRKSFYIGKLLNYSWHPDFKLRLVNKNANPRWEGYDAHEELKVDNQIEKIDSFLIHYSYRNMLQHFEKTVKYAKLSAESYQKAGRRFNTLNLFINPIYAFIKMYFIDLAFLDGIHGLIASTSSLIGTFLKYAFLWELERKR